jgi:ParB/RepB/Spo0J family partition protein
MAESQKSAGGQGERVETVLISTISKDPANVRRHNRKNLDAIKASLRAFGQQKPIVVSKTGIVLAGNGTMEAALELGWEKIQVIHSDLEGTAATAYAIADNRTAELAEWDHEGLAAQLAAIQINDEALAEAAGYSQEEIDKLAGNIEPELVPSRGIYQLVITLESESDQQKLYEQLEGEGYKCHVLTL